MSLHANTNAIPPIPIIRMVIALAISSTNNIINKIVNNIILFTLLS